MARSRRIFHRMICRGLEAIQSVQRCRDRQCQCLSDQQGHCSYILWDVHSFCTGPANRSSKLAQATASKSNHLKAYPITFSTASRDALRVAYFPPLGNYGFPERYAKLQGDFPIRSIRGVLHAATDFLTEK
jgi:hypothetical protein